MKISLRVLPILLILFLSVPASASDLDKKAKHYLERSKHYFFQGYDCKVSGDMQCARELRAFSMSMASMADGLENFERGNTLRARDKMEAAKLFLNRLNNLHSDGYLETMEALAESLLAIGDFEGSKAAYRKILQIKSDSARAQLEYIIKLDESTVVYSLACDFPKAAAIEELVLDEYRRILGENHDAVLFSMHSLVLSYCGMEQYDRAIALWEKFLPIAESKPGFDQDTIFSARELMATILLNLQDHVRAQELLHANRKESTPRTEPTNSETAKEKSLLGQAYQVAGDSDAAESLLREALTIYRQTTGLDNPEALETSASLADVYTCIDRLSEAEDLLNEILPVSEKILGMEHHQTVGIKYHLARNLLAQERFSEALPIAEHVVSAMEKSAPNIQKPHCRSLISFIFDGLGYKGAALFYAKMAVLADQTEHHRLAELSPEIRKGFLASSGRNYGSLAERLLDLGRIDEALEALNLVKMIELDFFFEDEPAKHGSKIAQEMNSLITVYEEINNSRKEIYHQRLALANDDPQLEALAIQERVLDQKLRKFIDDLPEEAEKALTKSPKSLFSGTRQIQNFLESTGSNAAVLHVYPAGDALWLILTTPNDPDLGSHIREEWDKSREDFIGNVDKFLVRLSDPSMDPTKYSRYFYDKIIAPMDDQLSLAKVDTLVFSFHGPLRYLPPAAFYDGEHWLIEKYALVMFSSLFENNLELSRRPPWTVSAFGSSRGNKKYNLPELPHVPLEIGALVNNVNGGCFAVSPNTHSAQVLGLMPGECLLDNQFTKTAFFERLRGNYQVAHVATHFVLNENDPGESRLFLGDEQELSLADFAEHSPPLAHFDLLAFSACQTGRGQDKEGLGREIDSLGLVGQRKGARSVLASLWSVNDDSTRALMVAFYKAREAGQSKAQALRSAQTALIKETPQSKAGQEFAPYTSDIFETHHHPYYWAPFILMGNWL